jgi:hypothetical protein
MHCRDTDSVEVSWVHVGRLWTNGEPFLAVDAAIRDEWHGFTADDFEQVITLSPEETGVTVGARRAVLIGADGVVRDDSWVEVFTGASGAIAVVQASGPDYPQALAQALAYPAAGDALGETLTVDSGELAIFSAACDGTGPYAAPFVPAQPGPVPHVHVPPSPDTDPGLLLTTGETVFQLRSAGTPDSMTTPDSPDGCSIQPAPPTTNAQPRPADT